MNTLKEKIRAGIRPTVAVIFALGIIWAILLLAQYDAALAFRALFDAGFKNIKSFGTVLNRTSPLLFTGLAVAFALRGNMMNIGA